MKGTTEYAFEPHDVAFEPDSHTVNTDTNQSEHQDTFTHQKEWHALLIMEDQDSTATDSDKLAVSVVKTQGGMTAIFVPNKEVFKELRKSLLVSQTRRIIGGSWTCISKGLFPSSISPYSCYPHSSV